MNALRADICRFLKNRWFYFAVIFTVVILWFDLWSEEDILLYGNQQDTAALLSELLGRKGTLLSLPLLAALPYSASIFQEMSTGAVRYAIFRCGYRVYLFSKMAAILLSAVLSQFAGLVIFSMAASFLAGTWIFFPAQLVLQRMLAASIFAMVGSVGAILSRDVVSAYIIPVMLVFALTMFQSRFFFEAEYLNPAAWLSNSTCALPFLAVLCVCMILLSWILTALEVRKYV